MRQIYNTAESPEMLNVFQMMDATVGICYNSTSAAKANVNQESLPQQCGQLSSYKNTSRLSLANLMPSRLA